MTSSRLSVYWPELGIGTGAQPVVGLVREHEIDQDYFTALIVGRDQNPGRYFSIRTTANPLKMTIP